jgi:hypothetical protein
MNVEPEFDVSEFNTKEDVDNDLLKDFCNEI